MGVHQRPDRFLHSPGDFEVAVTHPGDVNAGGKIDVGIAVNIF